MSPPGRASIHSFTCSRPFTIFSDVKSNLAVSIKTNAANYALLAALTLVASAQADIQYRVRLEPGNTGFDVFIDAKADSDATTFKIPAWSPGFCVLCTSCDERIKEKVQAQDSEGHLLGINHLDHLSWKVLAPSRTNIRFSYKVSGNDPGLGFFGMYLDSHVGFINGASTFMYIDGRKTEPDHLDPYKTPRRLGRGNRNGQGRQGLPHQPATLSSSTPYPDGHVRQKEVHHRRNPVPRRFSSSSREDRCDQDHEVEQLRLVQRLVDVPRSRIQALHPHPPLGAGRIQRRSGAPCKHLHRYLNGGLDLDDLAAHENFHAWS